MGVDLHIPELLFSPCTQYGEIAVQIEWLKCNVSNTAVVIFVVKLRVDCSNERTALLYKKLF